MSPASPVRVERRLVEGFAKSVDAGKHITQARGAMVES